MAVGGAATAAGQANGGPSTSTAAEYTPPAARRVSYVLNNVDTPPRYFRLPSVAEASTSSAQDWARTGPLLLPSDGLENDVRARSSSSQSSSRKYVASHPRHRLPISSLALDTTTVLSGASDEAGSSRVPKGIMYMGGRDGMISSWELGLPMRQRRRQRRGYGQGEDDMDDHIEGSDAGEDEDLDTRFSMDDLHGSSVHSMSSRGTQRRNKAWEVISPHTSGMSPAGPAAFRQCIGSHTDWINDILLVNNNQTVISASSDRTINLWNPHDPQTSLMPKVLGTHKDYVRALTHAPDAHWVASGSFDKTVKLWDIHEVRSEPILTIAEPHVPSSIYALSTNASGSVIVGGSPERVVRAWDPRSGKQIAQLIGHSDAVKSVLVSADGMHVLSASSDSTIRLWNLAEQRCLHTFTHHADSVWTLYSDHPDLDIFYSGDRSGLVCKVDWERCNEVSEGECVVLARDTALPDDEKEGFRAHSNLVGINKIVALQNSYFWAASASGSVSRWQDIPTRSTREALYPLAERSTPALHAISESAATASPAPALPSSPIATASGNPRVSALRGQQQHRSSSSVTSVSFATQVDERQRKTSYLRLSDSPPVADKIFDITHDDEPPGLFGIPFDSLVCLAPLDDPYGAAIGLGSLSVRRQSQMAPETYEGDAMFSSASLVSIPNALRSSYQALRDGEASVRSSMQIVRQLSSPQIEQAPLLSPTMQSNMREASGMRPVSVRSGSLRFAPALSSSYEDPTSVEARAREAQENKLSGNTEAMEEARNAYEERELAIDADPFRKEADDTIWCARGLIRSTALNDRRHCLSIDTAANIMVWDVLLGQCLGSFVWSDVLKGARASGITGSLQAGDALDLVRERIQGAGVAPNWCAVETRTGSLTVHLEYPRCFDAEVYTDEVQDAIQASDPSYALREDQRLNAGLTVLRSLFAGLLRKETALRLASNAPLKDGTLAYEQPDLLNRIASSPTAVARLPSRLQLSRAPMTPGMTIAVAQSPRTPAYLAAPSPLTPAENHGMSSLQKLLEDQRLASANKTSSPANVPYPQSDYFSLQRDQTSDATTPKQLKTPGVEKGTSVLSPGSGLMGRIRMGLKRDATTSKRDAKTPSGNEAESEQTTVDGEELTPAQSEAHKQLQALRALLKRASTHTEDVIETPQLSYNPSTSIILSESSHDAGGYRVIYRGLVKSAEHDVAMLELHSPPWLLEYLLIPSEAQLSSLRSKDKMTFMLVPWSGPAKSDDATLESNNLTDAPAPPLPPLPGNNARLTATKMLRIKKTCGYVADRLGLQEGSNGATTSGTGSIAASRRSSASTQALNAASASPENGATTKLAMSRLQQHAQSQQLSTSASSTTAPNGGSSEQGSESSGAANSAGVTIPADTPAHDVVEILCKDRVVPPHMTLAQVQRYMWKSSSVPKLEYRLK